MVFHLSCSSPTSPWAPQLPSFSSGKERNWQSGTSPAGFQRALSEFKFGLRVLRRDVFFLSS